MAEIMSRNALTSRMAALEARFPQQFAGPHIGISVYSGWIALFEKLCADIDRVDKEHGNQQAFRWRQVKEKLGALRAYYGTEACGLDKASNPTERSWLLGSDEEPASKLYTPSQWTIVRALVDAAQDASGTTCMFCGAHGTLRTNGWMFTSCEDHVDARARDYFYGQRASEPHSSPNFLNIAQRRNE